jgi:hypothetical protein
MSGSMNNSHELESEQVRNTFRTLHLTDSMKMFKYDRSDIYIGFIRSPPQDSTEYKFEIKYIAKPTSLLGSGYITNRIGDGNGCVPR